MYRWRALVCRAAGCHFFCRFFRSTAKPCMYIIIDDSDNETIASEQSQLCPCSLGRRTALPLAELFPPRATASPWSGPKGTRPEAGPMADPPKMHSTQKRAHQKTIKNEGSETESTKEIRNRLLHAQAMLTEHCQCFVDLGSTSDQVLQQQGRSIRLDDSFIPGSC